MHKYMDDVCMLTIIGGALVLLILGIDGEVKTILTGAALFFFGKTYAKIKSGGK